MIQTRSWISRESSPHNFIRVRLDEEGEDASEIHIFLSKTTFWISNGTPLLIIGGETVPTASSYIPQA